MVQTPESPPEFSGVVLGVMSSVAQRRSSRREKSGRARDPRSQRGVGADGPEAGVLGMLSLQTLSTYFGEGRRSSQGACSRRGCRGPRCGVDGECRWYARLGVERGRDSVP